ncbi:hypothetical protein J36TS2_36110 [Bacillus paralicheniformis]|jgi:hypothetical protein|nr:hypothetical protein J36TS2_36110 [Bacillus paralicheniformis]
MYLPSLVTGVLVDKIGRTAMSIASGVTLLLAGAVVALDPFIDRCPQHVRKGKECMMF